MITFDLLADIWQEIDGSAYVRELIENEDAPIPFELTAASLLV